MTTCVHAKISAPDLVTDGAARPDRRGLIKQQHRSFMIVLLLASNSDARHGSHACMMHGMMMRCCVQAMLIKVALPSLEATSIAT
jgi:hypothetical protein